MSGDQPDLVRYLTRAELERRQSQPPARPKAEISSTDGATVAVLRLYDVIDSWGGFWGISAGEVASVLDALPSGTAVEVHLNSPGGEATEGIAIANVLRQYPEPVTIVVDGLAASAASMVAMGGTEVVMAPSSQLMIHEAASGAWGDAEYLEQTAKMLHHLSDRYAEAYAGKAGGEPTAWRDLMRAETWYSPEEAVTAGLADRTTATSTDDPAAAVARHDLRVFAHAGRQHAPAPRLLGAAALGRPAAAGGTTREEPDSMSDTLIAGLRERLGTADDADEPTVLAALDEALAEQTDDTTSTATTTTTVPDGTVLVDAQAFEQMKVQAAAGEAARTQQLTERRERLVVEAARDGRIAPAQKQAWLTKLEEEGEDGEKVLASLAKGLIPVTDAVGFDDGTESSEDDAVYASLFPGEKKGA